MNLPPEDAELFFRLFFGLLAYTNRILQLTANRETAEEVRKLGTRGVLPIRNALYQHPKIFDEYIAENPERLSNQELDLIASWKHHITGNLYLMRYLKKYAVFLSTENPSHLYGVLGLHDSIADLLHQEPPPVLLKTALLPFKDKIICDGLIEDSPATFVLSAIPSLGIAAKDHIQNLILPRVCVGLLASTKPAGEPD